MRALQEKLKVWSLQIQEGNSDMLFPFSKTNNKETISSVIKHLKSLQDKIEKYFPTVSTENYKWVRNPFLPLDTHCILNLKKELIDIQNDNNIKLGSRFRYDHFDTTYFVARHFLHRLFRRQFGAL